MAPVVQEEALEVFVVNQLETEAQTEETEEVAVVILVELARGQQPGPGNHLPERFILEAEEGEAAIVTVQ